MRTQALTSHALRALAVLSLCAFQFGEAKACASCGSGSDDPLVLWPNEQLKTYVGVSTSGNFETVDTRGTTGKESGPKSRDAMTFAVGKALRNDLFFTLTVPVQQNRLGRDSLRSVGDPMVAGRWSWLLPDFTEPLQPQIQLMAYYKFAHAKALQESERLDLLDAFGTGIPETKLGIDTFWGQSKLKGGFAIAALFPAERMLGRAQVFPGNCLKTTSTLGMSLGGDNKLLAGMVREMREKRRNNGTRVSDSEILAHSVFMTLDWSPAARHMVRFTVSDKGRIFANRNMIAATSASVAWLATWE
ncbi:MAG: hypothetical protein FJY29_12510 [Betaproteobacteria bacterium]|nr:hypothetical protein [Betaproteobacteria bacterium]